MLPYGRQSINREDIEAVTSVLQGDLLTTGPAVRIFERDLEEWTGGTPTVAVSSGTAALHTAYFAAGIGPGDEIITPPLTFVATQAAAIALGASIAFADVTHDTGTLDPDAVEASITPRTKAIVAVDFAGHPADMLRLRSVADAHGLLLIEDAAHSLGSTYHGIPVGSLADITAFSFFPTKNITTAEGGAVAARDSQLLNRARRFARQGLVREPDRFRLQDQGPWHQEVHDFGLNYRLPDVLAALGSSQLRRLAEFKSKRAAIKREYDEQLAGCEGVRLPFQAEHVEPVWHLYPLRVPADQRLSVFEALRASGIGVQVNYMPAYWHPAFDEREFPRGICPVAEAYYLGEISLPMFADLTHDGVREVASIVRRAITSERNGTWEG